uniref:Uncharacterized protein n=1 Tax=Rhizophora mucronata TaxID=61149 RepID=A0A2P2PLJ4_RHIMU
MSDVPDTPVVGRTNSRL